MAKVLDSIEDKINGVVTIDLGDKRLRVCERAFRELGMRRVLEYFAPEYRAPTERVAVFQHGKRIGTLPPMFDPACVASKSWLYEARPGDFKLGPDGWIANKMLGPGDLDAVAGFQRD
jgi:hypothetical protein